MNVYITRILPDIGMDLLKYAGCIVTQYEGKQELTQSELIAACKVNDVLVSAGPNKIDKYFLEQCKHLKGIVLFSVGYDNVDIATATKLSIPVGNTPGVLSNASADVAFLLMLSVSRKAFFMHKNILEGKWNFYEPTAHLGTELDGKTLGIFGLGRIGYELARKCKGAYNMQVIYHNRKPNLLAENELGAKYVSFDDLLRNSDVLSVHVNLSENTRGVFDKKAFGKMKKNAIFINTARGSVHNEEDLAEALRTGQIWGAGLDVTNPEPMSPDNVLLSMPGVCVLPHIGSATKETRDAMAVIAAKNIIACLNGERMPHPVNPEVYN